MRAIKYLIAILTILGGLVLISNQAFLYSDKTTHPYLVEEMAKLYNYYYDLDITSEQIEWMKRGATNEDTWPRNWYNHFYDPINNRGFPFSAKEWAQSPEVQSKVSGGDHSWQTAISEYNAGYKQKAFYSLGHVLHLIEDMAVPAHTREDPHVGGDPLEGWAGNLPRNSEFYNIATPLIVKGIKPKIFNNLNAYFDEVANFSNRNFFSNSSIEYTIDKNNGQLMSNAKYPGPKIVKEGWENGKKYGYGKVTGVSNLIRLVRIEEQYDDKYFLRYKNDDSPEIHAEYFPLLSKEAVINGAGVMKLFFNSITEPEQEIVESEKQLSFWQKISNIIEASVKFVTSAVDGLIHTPVPVIETVTQEIIQETMPAPEYLTVGPRIIEGTKKSIDDESEARPPIPPQGGFASGSSSDEKIQSISEVQSPEEKLFLVKRVIDGDTIVLENGQEVRYIGIDAPEFPNGCFAQQSTDKNKELIEGKQVRLEKDSSETDKYGRLLRYVYVMNEVEPHSLEIFINDYLVRNGYAYDFAYGSDIKYEKQFADAEEEAKENRQGLWGDACHPFIGGMEGLEENGPQIVQGQKIGGSGGVSPRIAQETQNQSQSQEIFSSEISSGTEEQSSISEGTLGDELSFASSEGGSEDELSSVSFEGSEEVSEGEQPPEEDITPPDVSFNPLIYNYASSSVTIQWVSSESSSVSFDVEYKQGDGDWQNLLENTTETQINFIAENQDTTYYFRVHAKDLSENESEWQESSVEILPKPIVINEIAWMGTRADYNDEWIELFNRADYDIDLTSWSLKANDSSPDIVFIDGDKENKITINKIIKAKGYYLLERTSDNATSQLADWYGSFGSGGLNNTGEVLELRDNFGNVIDLVNGWYAGNNEAKRTMERINPDRVGAEPKNWKTYIGSGSSITDSKGNPIFGTPKAKNSVYKLYTAVTKNITENTTWTLDNSPYLVYDNSGNSYELLEIAEGATLTIEPGVIVKFVNPGLKVYGTIKAQGSSDKPIIFTDYNDKEYAGEVFGSTVSSQAGAWSGIWITESSTDSVFDHVVIRYAGSRTRPFRTGSTYSFPGVAVGAGIRVENTSIILKNSTIENNLFAGVLLINSANTIIENSTFQNHLEYDNSYSTLASPTEFRNRALYIDSSNPQIKNSTFQNNITGIYIENNSGPIIENNIFSNNFRPIWVRNSYPQFSDNQIEDNNWDGIVLTDLKLNQDYTLSGGSVFINYDSIPSWSIVVPEEYTLTIEPGTIIKSVAGTSGLRIEGTLIAEGATGEPIVFTSFYDDEYGGDTNGDGDATKDNAVPGSWGQIVFMPTSTNSSLNYAIIRYGGTKWGGSDGNRPDYVLKIEGSSLSLTNSIIENNISGFRMENSNSHIANTTFRNHQYSSSSFFSIGLYLVSSAPTIDISTFLNNKLGIYIDAGSWLDLDLTSLVFENNSKNVEDMRPAEEPENP